MDQSLYERALAPFLAETEQLRPADAEVIDAHTHLGLDEDGRALTLEQLLALLDAAGARRACVFPLHDPDRQPGYRVPNDIGADVCDYPLARNLVLLAVAVASEVIIRFAANGSRENWTVTLKDFAVRPA